MTPTFSSFSFGCRVNQAEVESLNRELLVRGYKVDSEFPDVYIINTCSVTHKAEREARQMINQLRSKFGSETKIVVMGCAATNWIKTKTDIPEADLLIDNPSKAYIAEILAQRFPELEKRDNPDPHIETVLADDKYTRSGRRILKIQDGCQRFCTYCIVPYLRGLPKSTPVNELVRTIQKLPPQIKEVIYTAINTEAYGYDTKQEDFLDLLRFTLEHTAIPRLSFGSIHPWSINEKLFSLLETHPEAARIVQFYHIPLQSGSNKMLQLMKRGYTREEFVEKLQRLVKIQPMAFIGTDIISGFLEESDRDFEDTYSFLEQTPVSKIHVFRYSTREHTAAWHLGKRLQEPTPQQKHKRAAALRKLSEQKWEAFMEKHVKKQDFALLLEETVTDGAITVGSKGVLSNGVPCVVVGTDLEAGEIIKVTVEDYKSSQLVATVLK